MGFISDDVLRRLRAQLDAREAQLRDEVRRLAGEEFDPRDGVPMDYIEDAGEQAEQRARRTVRRAEQERDISELRAIAGARERMAHGTYGQCVDCGTDIPIARLEIEPWAARCIPCQQRSERTPPAQPPKTS